MGNVRHKEHSWNWAQFRASGRSGRPAAPSFYLERSDQRHGETDSKMVEATAVTGTVSQI